MKSEYLIAMKRNSILKLTICKDIELPTSHTAVQKLYGKGAGFW